MAAILTACASNIVYRQPHTIYTEMFAILLSILTFTAVRACLPGAPVGFGTSSVNLPEQDFDSRTTSGADIGSY